MSESLCDSCTHANVDCPVFPIDTQKCVNYSPACKCVTCAHENEKDKDTGIVLCKLKAYGKDCWKWKKKENGR